MHVLVKVIHAITAAGLIVGGSITVAHAQSKAEAIQRSNQQSGASTSEEELRRTRSLMRKSIEQQPKPQSSSATLGRKVTYEDILKDPDNLALNFAYAQTLVEEGRLEQASSTLERLLILNPDQPRIRLFYAAILFRLDNLDEADNQLAGVLADPTTDLKTRNEAEDFQDKVAAQRARASVYGSLAYGVHADSNRNAFPRNSLFFALDNLAVGEGKENSDMGNLYVAAAGAKYDLGTQSRDEVFFNITYLSDNQVEEKDLSVRGVTTDIGFNLKTAWFDMTPKLEMTHARLGEKAYLNYYVKVQNRLERKLAAKWSGFLQGNYGWEDYENSLLVVDATNKEGPKGALSSGLSFAVLDNMSLGLSYERTTKFARVASENFWRDEVVLDHNWAIAPWLVSLTSLSYNETQYEEPEGTLTTTKVTREDHILNWRTTFAVPLSETALGDMSKFLTDDTLISATVGYTDQASNVPNYDYFNWRGQMMLSKRFGF